MVGKIYSLKKKNLLFKKRRFNVQIKKKNQWLNPIS